MSKYDFIISHGMSINKFKIDYDMMYFILKYIFYFTFEKTFELFNVFSIQMGMFH